MYGSPVEIGIQLQLVETEAVPRYSAGEMHVPENPQDEILQERAIHNNRDICQS
jgi:hypothetical protein